VMLLSSPHEANRGYRLWYPEQILRGQQYFAINCWKGYVTIRKKRIHS
jgi:hypothetical protein